mgnify:CR=1 FL=1
MLKILKKITGFLTNLDKQTAAPAPAKPSRPSPPKSPQPQRPETDKRKRERRKKHHDDDTRTAVAVEQTEKKSKKKRKKSHKDSDGDSASFTVKEKPKRPEHLEIIPEEEGKVRFGDLTVHDDILYGLQELDFKYCTPIQAKALPPLLKGRDLTGKAQTGTGKTAAFLIAAFTHILNNPQEERRAGTCRALVLAPTRELAIQIHKDAEALSCFAGLNNLVIFGGMDYKKQRDRLEKPIDVLIGTPGRIIDYSRSGFLNLSKTEILVIDEADRMLDMGFIPDVRRIVSQLPPTGKRQTMLFSATLDAAVTHLVERWLTDPVVVESESEQLVTDLIDQQFYVVTRREKLPMLLWILSHEQYERIIIFGNRKDRNEDLVRQLSRYNIYTALLSGDVPQEKRMKILERFRKGTERILIATDVAARGIHVDDVSLVINYDLPERAEDYVHRIGRTGRAGHAGKSISLVCEFGGYVLPEIEKQQNTEFACVIPDEEMVKLPSQFEWRDRVALREKQEHERRMAPEAKAEAAAIIEAGGELSNTNV